MRKIFIFTAGQKEAREHLEVSIINPFPTSWFDDYLDLAEADDLKSLLPNPDYAYAWGAVPGPRNVPMWNDMADGDIVLTVYDNRYHFISTVLAKLHAPALASRIWGVDDEGKTWEYMYLLSQPREVDVGVFDEPVVSYLSKGYRGFTQISEEKLDRIQNEFGSIDGFAEGVFGVQLPSSVSPLSIEYAEKQVEAESEAFAPDNLNDARKKVLAEIVRRRGQSKFRKSLLEAYEGRCAVTGCAVESVLEAAHIIQYLGDDTNHITNGLLLRADIHTLYDLGALRIDDDGIVVLTMDLIGSIYEQYNEKLIAYPKDPAKHPNKTALARRFFQSLHEVSNNLKTATEESFAEKI